MSASDDLLKKRRESQDYFSAKVSDLARYMGFGLAAASFALLTSEARFAVGVTTSYPMLLVIAAACGCLVVLLDYLQMFSGWQSATLSAANEAGGYKKTPAAESWYKAQMVCFYGKQILAVLGAILLLVAIASQIGGG